MIYVMFVPFLLIYVLYASCIFLWWFFTRKEGRKKQNPIFKVTFYITVLVVFCVASIVLSQVLRQNLLERKVSSFPSYPDAETIDVSAHVNGDDGTFASIEYSIPNSGSDSDIQDFYINFFEREGWRVLNSSDITGDSFIARKKGSEIQVNVSYKDIRYRTEGLSLEEQVRLQLSRDKSLTKVIAIVYKP